MKRRVAFWRYSPDSARAPGRVRLKMTTPLTLEAVNGGTCDALASALTDGDAPVSLAVVDVAGCLVGFQRMDGAPQRTVAIAIGKAYTSARMQQSTEVFSARLRNDGLLVADFLDPGLTSLPGGVPLIVGETLLGAVGVSGRSLANDAQLARRLATAIVARLASAS